MTYYIEDTGIEFPVIEKNKQTSGGRQDDILYFIHRNLNSSYSSDIISDKDNLTNKKAETNLFLDSTFRSWLQGQS